MNSVGTTRCTRCYPLFLRSKGLGHETIRGCGSTVRGRGSTVWFCSSMRKFSGRGHVIIIIISVRVRARGAYRYRDRDHRATKLLYKKLESSSLDYLKWNKTINVSLHAKRLALHAKRLDNPGVDDREHLQAKRKFVLYIAILHIHVYGNEQVTLVHACAIAQAHTHYLATPTSPEAQPDRLHNGSPVT